MTTITLHDYLRKIDELLAENRFSEAASHCRHILEQYPRHVDTYRVLAKALLEQRQYEDAGDLFQRILSADPNDLVAHVGLADVYKQESLLDQSLWHLERAFELEPYNHVIQDELRQLYARHNDVTLERIPLNQAALARIYLREELYQQAVSELQQALSHNGDRVDLEVVLAEALWRDGQRAEAAEVCQRILEQLPNCITANAILADIWLQAGQASEAHVYLRRVQALMQLGSRQLDLETAVGHAFILEGAPPLPDEVMIEMLEIAPEDATPATPAADWVSQVTFPDAAAAQPAVETENGYEYDWLAGIDEAAEPSVEDSDFDDVADLFGEGEPLIADEVAAGEPELTDTAGDMPSWLKEQAATDMLTHDEIPEWLSEGAAESETAADETVAESAAVPADMPEWLSDISSVDDFEPMGADSMLASEWFVESEDEEAELPAESAASVGEDDDWLAALGTATSPLSTGELEESTGAEPAIAGEDDDWLATLARDTGELSEQLTADDEAAEVTEFDDWMAPDTAAVEYGDDVTDWLLGSDVTEQSELEEAMAGIPVDDSDKKDSGLEGVPEPEDTTSDDRDDAMTWLDALTAQEDEPEPPIMEELAGEELPDWLADLSGPAESDDVAEAAATAPGYADNDLPEWLRASSLDDDLLGIEQAEAATTEEDEPDYSEAVEDEGVGALDWLDQLAAGAPVEQMPTLEWESDEAEPTQEWRGESDEAEPTLDWLREMAAPPDETLVNLALVQEEGADRDYEVAEEDTIVDVPEDLDDAMAWLEELAAHQGAPVEELPTVANVLETDMVDAFDDEERVAAETTEPFVDVPEDLDEAMAWLEELAARQGVPLEELPGVSGTREEAGGEPEVDVLAVEVEEEMVVEEVDVLPESDEALAEAEIDLDDAMAWLEDLMGQQDEPVEMWEEGEDLEEPAAMVADQDETAVEPETGAVPETITAHDELAEALDWLEQVALEEGPFEKGPLPEMGDVGRLEVTDDELAEVLDWLEQVAVGVAPPPAEPADELFDVSAEPELDFLADMPDDPDEAMAWLERLAARQGAPLEELPSMAPGEDEEITTPAWAMPAWLEAEATVEEMEFAGDADVAEVEPEEVLAAADDQAETIGAAEPEAEAPLAEAEVEAPAPGEEADEEEQLVIDEAEWPEALSEVDVMDWLAAEEEATVISSEMPAPVPATGLLLEAPPKQPAEVDYGPELDVEDESLILADVEPVTSALTLDEAQLAQARQSLAGGNYEEAMHSYHSLVTKGEGLITLIGDLETAVNQHPQRPLLRRVLGDAYIRNGQLQKALETYRETLDML